MLRADPRPWTRRTLARTRTWWRSGPTRLRLRRRLGVLSIPVTVLLLAGVAKLISVLLVGGNAAADFTAHDSAALRDDIDALSTLNVIDPHKVPFARGDLAVLEGRIEDAERDFAAAAAQTPAGQACTVRVNLELVRETLGDLAARSGDKQQARQRYRSALDVVNTAEPHCFTDNSDANTDRRRIRNATPQRLRDKIESLDRPPPPPPTPAKPATPRTPTSAPLTPSTAPPTPTAGPPTPEAPSPPPPPPGPGGSAPVFGPGNGTGGGGDGSLNDVDPDRLPVQGSGPEPGHALGGGGDPLEKLHAALGDSAASGPSHE